MLKKKGVSQTQATIQTMTHIYPTCNTRGYSTYRVVTTNRLKAHRHLVVHDNLKMFTKYSTSFV